MGGLEKIKKVYMKERGMQDTINRTQIAWLKFILKRNRGSPLSMKKVMLDTFCLMGSFADGAFSARLFSEKQVTVEVDFLVEIIRLPEEVITPVPNQPGFYSVKYDEGIMKFLVGLARLFLASQTHIQGEVKLKDLFPNQANQCGFLLGVSMKKFFKAIANLNNIEIAVRQLMAKVLEVEYDRIMCIKSIEFNGPATTNIIQVNKDHQHQLTFSYDLVAGARLSFWPPEAMEWASRRRTWPPPDTVHQIIRECKVHLVAKPSDEFKRENGREWRLTFLAEKQIISEWTFEMKFTYYLFKVLFYEYFKKETEGKNLSSYLAKTTMYWYCEEVDPNIWTEDNVAMNVQALLKKICSYLLERHLPHYFVIKLNLLANVPVKLLENVEQMGTTQLLADPISWLPTNTEQVESRLDFISKVLEAWAEYYVESTEALPEKEPRGRPKFPLSCL